MLYKLCNKCFEWKPCNKEYFYSNDKNKSDGLFPNCKQCGIEKAKQYQQNNYNNAARSKRKWYLKDKKSNQEYGKNYMKKRDKKLKQKSMKKFNTSSSGKKKQKIYIKRYSYKKHKISNNEWNKCKEFFNYSCAYCGMTEAEHKKLYNQQLHKEHVIHNGRNDIKNCIPSCKQCNSEKHKSSLNNWYNIKNPKFNKKRYYLIYLWIKNICHKINKEVKYVRSNCRII